MMNNTPDFFKETFPIPCSMSRAEQFSLIHILQNIKPKVAIELGTYKGGSLQVISAYSEKVYAIDLNENYRDERCNALKNVEYCIGDSKSVLPQLIASINSNGEQVEFILIDGDHSQKGVLADITNALKLIPKSPVVIIMHDSFNPNCRKGMKAYNYNANPYVHHVELDYVTGAFDHDGLHRQMWGGFAAIFLNPEKRTQNLVVNAYQKRLYKTTYYRSIHFYRKWYQWLRPIYKVFKK